MAVASKSDTSRLKPERTLEAKFFNAADSCTACARSLVDKYILRELSAKPSGARVVGQVTISTGSAN